MRTILIWLLLTSCCWAADFDGVDAVVRCGNDTSLDTGTVFTALGWFRLDATNDAGYVASKMNTTFNGGWTLHHAQLDVFVHQNASGPKMNTTGDIIDSTTTWYFAAASIDGAGDNSLRVFNNEEDTATNILNTDTTDDFLIGGKEGSTFPNWTNGEIESVKFYDVALSPSEMSSVFFGINQCPRGNVGFWLLHEASGTDLTHPDLSGTGNDGVAEDGVTGSTNGPPVTWHSFGGN